MTASTTRLGFEHVDVCMQLPNGEWKILATSGPRRRQPAADAGRGREWPSRRADLDEAEVVVDTTTPTGRGGGTRRGGSDHVGAVDRGQHRRSLHRDPGCHLRSSWSPAPGSIDALRLLCGQAAVALQNNQLVTELQDVQVELEHQAMHDALTGLPEPRPASSSELQRRARRRSTDPHRRHVGVVHGPQRVQGRSTTRSATTPATISCSSRSPERLG